MRVQATQPRPEALNAAVRVLSRLPAVLTRSHARLSRHLGAMVAATAAAASAAAAVSAGVVPAATAPARRTSRTR